MDIVLTIPDRAAPGLRDLQNGSPVPLARRLLELAAIRAYETSESFGEKEVMDFLGFEDRETLYEFFKANGVESDYAAEDLRKDSASAARELALSADANPDAEEDALVAAGLLRRPAAELTDDFWQMPAPQVSTEAILAAIQADRDER